MTSDYPIRYTDEEKVLDIGPTRVFESPELFDDVVSQVPTDELNRVKSGYNNEIEAINRRENKFNQFLQVFPGEVEDLKRRQMLGEDVGRDLELAGIIRQGVERERAYLSQRRGEISQLTAVIDNELGTSNIALLGREIGSTVGYYLGAHLGADLGMSRWRGLGGEVRRLTREEVSGEDAEELRRRGVNEERIFDETREYGVAISPVGGAIGDALTTPALKQRVGGSGYDAYVNEEGLIGMAGSLVGTIAHNNYNFIKRLFTDPSELFRDPFDALDVTGDIGSGRGAVKSTAHRAGEFAGTLGAAFLVPAGPVETLNILGKSAATAKEGTAIARMGAALGGGELAYSKLPVFTKMFAAYPSVGRAARLVQGATTYKTVKANLAGPLVGAGGGFLATEGDTIDRLQGALAGGIAGFLGGKVLGVTRIPVQGKQSWKYVVQAMEEPTFVKALKGLENPEMMKEVARNIEEGVPAREYDPVLIDALKDTTLSVEETLAMEHSPEALMNVILRYNKSQMDGPARGAVLLALDDLGADATMKQILDHPEVMRRGITKPRALAVIHDTYPDVGMRLDPTGKYAADLERFLKEKKAFQGTGLVDNAANDAESVAGGAGSVADGPEAEAAYQVGQRITYISGNAGPDKTYYDTAEIVGVKWDKGKWVYMVAHPKKPGKFLGLGEDIVMDALPVPKGVLSDTPVRRTPKGATKTKGPKDARARAKAALEAQGGGSGQAAAEDAAQGNLGARAEASLPSSETGTPAKAVEPEGLYGGKTEDELLELVAPLEDADPLTDADLDILRERMGPGFDLASDEQKKQVRRNLKDRDLWGEQVTIEANDVTPEDEFLQQAVTEEIDLMVKAEQEKLLEQGRVMTEAEISKFKEQETRKVFDAMRQQKSVDTEALAARKEAYVKAAVAKAKQEMKTSAAEMKGLKGAKVQKINKEMLDFYTRVAEEEFDRLAAENATDQIDALVSYGTGGVNKADNIPTDKLVEERDLVRQSAPDLTEEEIDYLARLNLVEEADNAGKQEVLQMRAESLAGGEGAGFNIVKSSTGGLSATKKAQAKEELRVLTADLGYRRNGKVPLGFIRSTYGQSLKAQILEEGIQASDPRALELYTRLTSQQAQRRELGKQIQTSLIDEFFTTLTPEEMSRVAQSTVVDDDFVIRYMKFLEAKDIVVHPDEVLKWTHLQGKGKKANKPLRDQVYAYRKERSDTLRGLLKDNPEAPTPEVIAAMKDRGIEVSPLQVQKMKDDIKTIASNPKDFAGFLAFPAAKALEPLNEEDDDNSAAMALIMGVGVLLASRGLSLKGGIGGWLGKSSAASFKAFKTSTPVGADINAVKGWFRRGAQGDWGATVQARIQDIMDSPDLARVLEATARLANPTIDDMRAGTQAVILRFNNETIRIWNKATADGPDNLANFPFVLQKSHRLTTPDGIIIDRYPRVLTSEDLLKQGFTPEQLRDDVITLKDRVYRGGALWNDADTSNLEKGVLALDPSATPKNMGWVQTAPGKFTPYVLDPGGLQSRQSAFRYWSDNFSRAVGNAINSVKSAARQPGANSKGLAMHWGGSTQKFLRNTQEVDAFVRAQFDIPFLSETQEAAGKALRSFYKMAREIETHHRYGSAFTDPAMAAGPGPQGSALGQASSGLHMRTGRLGGDSTSLHRRMLNPQEKIPQEMVKSKPGERRRHLRDPHRRFAQSETEDGIRVFHGGSLDASRSTNRRMLHVGPARVAENVRLQYKSGYANSLGRDKLWEKTVNLKNGIPMIDSSRNHDVRVTAEDILAGMKLKFDESEMTPELLTVERKLEHLIQQWTGEARQSGTPSANRKYEDALVRILEEGGFDHIAYVNSSRIEGRGLQSKVLFTGGKGFEESAIIARYMAGGIAAVGAVGYATEHEDHNPQLQMQQAGFSQSFSALWRAIRGMMTGNTAAKILEKQTLDSVAQINGLLDKLVKHSSETITNYKVSDDFVALRDTLLAEMNAGGVRQMEAQKLINRVGTPSGVNSWRHYGSDSMLWLSRSGGPIIQPIVRNARNAELLDKAFGYPVRAAARTMGRRLSDESRERIFNAIELGNIDSLTDPTEIVAAEFYEKTFQQLVEMTNASRIATGLKPIRLRKNYITHFFENTNPDSWVAYHDGVAGQIYNRFVRRRSDKSGYVRDAARAFDTYLDVVLKDTLYSPVRAQLKSLVNPRGRRVGIVSDEVFRHMDEMINVQSGRYRAPLDKFVMGFAQMVGGKTGQSFVKGARDIVNFHIYASKLGMSPRAAMVNLGQNFFTAAEVGPAHTYKAIAQLMKVGSGTAIPGAIAGAGAGIAAGDDFQQKAIFGLAGGVAGGLGGKAVGKTIAKKFAGKVAYKSGEEISIRKMLELVDPTLHDPNDLMENELRAVMPMLEKLTGHPLGMGMFQATERFNREVAGLAGWYDGLEKGLSGQALVEHARDTIQSTQFWYLSGGRPGVFTKAGTFAAPALAFKSFPVRSLDFFIRQGEAAFKAAKQGDKRLLGQVAANATLGIGAMVGTIVAANHFGLYIAEDVGLTPFEFFKKASEGKPLDAIDPRNGPLVRFIADTFGLETLNGDPEKTFNSALEEFVVPATIQRAMAMGFPQLLDVHPRRIAQIDGRRMYVSKKRRTNTGVEVTPGNQMAGLLGFRTAEQNRVFNESQDIYEATNERRIKVGRAMSQLLEAIQMEDRDALEDRLQDLWDTEAYNSRTEMKRAVRRAIDNARKDPITRRLDSAPKTVRQQFGPTFGR